jgi:lipid-A-disaccharide synthase
LILDKKSIIELIQDDFNPKKLKSEIEKIIEDKNTQDEISQDYLELRKKLGTSIPSTTVAKSVVSSFDKV